MEGDDDICEKNENFPLSLYRLLHQKIVIKIMKFSTCYIQLLETTTVDIENF